jgi:hypothetical protein
MKNQKPSQYSNYITFRDVFHPESLYATEPAPSVGTTDVPVVVIDEPHHPVAGANKWNIVWAEATLLKDDSADIGGVTNDNAAAHHASTTAAAPAANGTTPADSAPTLTILDAPYHHSGFMESAIGIPLMIGAVAATAMMELGTLLVYGIAVGMHAFALRCKKTNCGVFSCILLLLYFIFEVHVAALMLLDYALLIGSVAISESLAYSCWIVSSIFSCCRCGMQWHQYIRRVCHVTRWAFRDFHRHWEPSRSFPCGRPREPSQQETASLDHPPPHISPTVPIDSSISVDPYDVSKPE